MSFSASFAVYISVSNTNGIYKYFTAGRENMSKMKIAILTLPRTGSKMLQQNLQSYLTARDSSTLSIDHPSLGLGEFLVKTRLASDECLVPHVEFIAPNRLEYSSDKTPASDELANRINLITSLNNSLVIKEFVFDSFDLSSIFSMSIKHGPLWNLPHLETLVQSFPYQKRPLIYSLLNKKSLKNLNPPKTEKVQILDFSDLVQCTTNKDFCQLLNLPIVDFTFVSKTKELDTDKFEMIENLDEVKAWITSCLNQ